MRYVIDAEILENDKAITEKKAELGCFVMLTNVQPEGEEGLSAKEVLQAYKEQHGIEKTLGFSG